MLCVASVDQLYVEPLLLKDLKNWDPVDPGRFHDDRIDPARAQPVSKSMKVRRKCSKGAYWLGIAIRRDRHHVHRGANVARLRQAAPNSQIHAIAFMISLMEDH